MNKKMDMKWWQFIMMLVAAFLIGGVAGWASINPDQAGYYLQISALQSELQQTQNRIEYLEKLIAPDGSVIRDLSNSTLWE